MLYSSHTESFPYCVGDKAAREVLAWKYFLVHGKYYNIFEIQAACLQYTHYLKPLQWFALERYNCTGNEAVNKIEESAVI